MVVALVKIIGDIGKTYNYYYQSLRYSVDVLKPVMISLFVVCTPISAYETCRNRVKKTAGNILRHWFQVT